MNLALSHIHRRQLCQAVRRQQNSSVLPLTVTGRAIAARYGTSAGTTFAVLRRYDVPAALALATVRAQVEYVGPEFPGGLACVPFRHVRTAADLQRVTASLALLPARVPRTARVQRLSPRRRTHYRKQTLPTA